MNTTLKMLRLNVPLSQWREFEKGEDSKREFYGGYKNPENLAKSLLAQLTHAETVVLIAREWESYPSTLRVLFTDLANKEYKDPSSNNKAKKIKDLDVALKGKILSREFSVTETELKVIAGKLVRTHKVVRPEVAGAMKKYASYKKKSKKSRKSKKS